ncbi:MAG: V-type ATP synthase subunit F [bacterium]
MSGKALAIVGQRETIMPFLVTGAQVVYIKQGEGTTAVEDLIAQGFKIIFFTEEFINELDGILMKYRNQTTPCLIPIPTGRGKTKLAIERIRGVIKKAVGADVFLEEK